MIIRDNKARTLIICCLVILALTFISGCATQIKEEPKEEPIEKQISPIAMEIAELMKQEKYDEADEKIKSNYSSLDAYDLTLYTNFKRKIKSQDYCGAKIDGTFMLKSCIYNEPFDFIKKESKEFFDNLSVFATEYIKKGECEKAIRLLVSHLDNNTNRVLSNYANALVNEHKDVEMSKHYIGCISPQYEGPLDDEIRSFAKKYFETTQMWQEEYYSLQKIRQQMDAPKPSVGMSSNDVLKSNWGSPNRVNKTTTRYGVSEQWVYSGSRYVYLENGIVTAVQE